MLQYVYIDAILGVNMQDNDIIKIITEKQHGMSKGHRAIASYIVDHYDTVAFITASRLTVGANTNTRDRSQPQPRISTAYGDGAH